MSDAFPRKSTPEHAHAQSVISRSQALWLVGLVLGILVLLSLGGESWQLALRYERDGLARGEYWRLLTGHLVHGSPQHLLLNGAGLALIAALFPRDYSLAQWLIIVFVSIAAMDVGFVWFQPQLQWYVGFSGVLHGALAAGAVAWWRHETKALATILTVIFIAKLAWEQRYGPLPLSGDMRVIVEAHLYGAIGGALAGLALWLRQRHWPSGARSL